MEEQEAQVLISLYSSAAAEGEEAEAISLFTTGQLTQSPQGHTLRYEEALDEAAPPTQVEIFFGQDAVTMRRGGAYDVSMVFRKSQRYEGQYRTPYGTFDLALFCTKASFAVDGQEGELHLEYQLDINGQFVAMHKLELCFTGKENGAGHESAS